MRARWPILATLVPIEPAVKLSMADDEEDAEAMED
jgi:hypothetical protein